MFDRELRKILEHLRIAFKNSVSLILFSHEVDFCAYIYFMSSKTVKFRSDKIKNHNGVCNYDNLY